MSSSSCRDEEGVSEWVDSRPTCVRIKQRALWQRRRHELTERERHLRRKVIEWVNEMFYIFCRRREAYEGKGIAKNIENGILLFPIFGLFEKNIFVENVSKNPTKHIYITIFYFQWK